MCVGELGVGVQGLGNGVSALFIEGLGKSDKIVQSCYG